MTIPATRDEASAPYFDALGRGKLVLRSCTRCGHVGRPDSDSCKACHSDDLTWTESCGLGTVVTAVVDHSIAPQPIVLALVELAEGPWIAGRILDAVTADETPASTPVRLNIVRTGDGEPIPAFVRAQ